MNIILLSGLIVSGLILAWLCIDILIAQRDKPLRVIDIPALAAVALLGFILLPFVLLIMALEWVYNLTD